MITPTLKTAEYPTRYVASEFPGKLIINENPEDRGGFEFAVYHSDNLHIDIVSYQGTSVLMDVAVKTRDAWNRVYCGRHGSLSTCIKMVDDFVFPPLFSYCGEPMQYPSLST